MGGLCGRACNAQCTPTMSHIMRTHIRETGASCHIFCTSYNIVILKVPIECMSDKRDHL